MLSRNIHYGTGSDILSIEEALPIWAAKQLREELEKDENPIQVVFHRVADFEPNDEMSGNWWLDSLDSRTTSHWSCDKCTTIYSKDVTPECACSNEHTHCEKSSDALMIDAIEFIRGSN